MSQGLGSAQRLVLNALALLEAENGGGERFYIWAIVDQLYALSPEMQARDRTARDAHAASMATIRERADKGDDKASLYMALTRSLIRSRPSPRKRRTAPFWIAETGFNPSRVLASLERRGLVSRKAVKGGGSAGLTEEGRRLAAHLSVGTSLPFVASGTPRTAEEMLMSNLDAKREEIAAHVARELGFDGLAGLSPTDRAAVDQQTSETIAGCDPTSPEPADCSSADREMRKLLSEYHTLQETRADENNTRLADEGEVFAPEDDA